MVEVVVGRRGRGNTYGNREMREVVEEWVREVDDIIVFGCVVG